MSLFDALPMLLLLGFAEVGELVAGRPAPANLSALLAWRSCPPSTALHRSRCRVFNTTQERTEIITTAFWLMVLIACFTSSSAQKEDVDTGP
eukprot:CAMPEP_0206464908 /NCGR_PEP_ID=MMETSP0324_2-20121206/27497_1 /ASSEMBLY_ACC=CAM_ASM_000836 /TAXON_ID=2866 /ORGANISM="Crypthecodinium cohnii, Strain Seligo" /LENGTH=91 /DNA_ID=CAMNT_0053937631 /DNA_START=335 /DNA_END=606 /DNA_ORIENTATION=-